MCIGPCRTVDDVEVPFISGGENWVNRHVLQLRDSSVCSVLSVEFCVEVCLNISIGIPGDVIWRRPVLANVRNIVSHCHSHSRFDAFPSLRAVDFRHRGYINRLRDASTSDWFPIVLVDGSHDVGISEDCLSLNHSKSDISINSFNQVTVRVIVEGVHHDDVRIHSCLELSNKGIPVCCFSRIACDHCS